MKARFEGISALGMAGKWGRAVHLSCAGHKRRIHADHGNEDARYGEIILEAKNALARDAEWRDRRRRLTRRQQSFGLRQGFERGGPE
jgi:hypothetical protein